MSGNSNLAGSGGGKGGLWVQSLAVYSFDVRQILLVMENNRLDPEPTTSIDFRMNANLLFCDIAPVVAPSLSCPPR
jgi:hypothetical protein